MSDSDVALHVEGVSKRFGGVHAVRETSLTVLSGERISMIGTNGAGKSTFFNLVAGVFPVTTGRIELFGENVTRMSSARRARRGLGRTFQTSKLFEQLTVAENVFVALGGVHFPGASLQPVRYSADRWKRVTALLEQVSLPHRYDTVVADLSHGEQRQLEIAMALAIDPRLLMLDEPAAGFSPAERQHLVQLLRDIPEQITLMLIEHDMDIALAVASRVVVMHDGEKILDGSPDEIRASQRVRDIYLGGSVDSAA